MANIKELKLIFQHTSPDQAILLRGVHGIGKSQLLTQIAKENDAELIALFLGQSADAGDIIGLPHKYETVGSDGNKVWITDFAAPKWWPTSNDKPVWIFLDELNRGKPEMMQCVQDLTLNRKLNGKSLPPGSRIIAAINPITDGYYQVEELDPTLLDRFNVYDFNPTPGEWIDWATGAGEIHEAVVGFIAKNMDFLDPPNAKDAKADQVYPSRRSWERVSVNLKSHPHLLTNKDRILQNQLHGIVGLGASSAFINFLKEYGSGLSAGLILTKWDEKMEMKVSQIDVQQQIHMVNQICVHLDQKYEEYEKAGAVVSKKIVSNLEHFLNTIYTEAMASFFGRVKSDYQEKQKKWPTWVVTKNKHLGDKFKEVMNRKSE